MAAVKALLLVNLMTLTGLDLISFRNYLNQSFTFSPGITLILGPNATGKTNILEALMLLSTGDSFRAKKTDELIGWGSELAHVVGHINQDPPLDLRLTLTRGEFQGKKTPKRRFIVNDISRRKKDFAGNLPAISFRPEDLRLVEGSPPRRRAYLDTVLTQTDSEYARSLSAYEKGLRHRNRLLTQIREGEAPVSALTFWDQLLLKNGDYLLNARRHLANYLNQTPAWGEARLLDYRPSVLSAEKLEKNRPREIAAGHTLSGPHKDDFGVLSGSLGDNHEGRDLALYGSRGEQRLAVLWLKLSELSYLSDHHQQRPLLLLDDIFSELDQAHSRLVLKLLGKQQTIITSTHMLPELESAQPEVIRL